MTSSSWMTTLTAFYLATTGKKRTKQSKKDKQRGTLALLFIIGSVIIILGILMLS